MALTRGQLPFPDTYGGEIDEDQAGFLYRAILADADRYAYHIQRRRPAFPWGQAQPLSTATLTFRQEKMGMKAIGMAGWWYVYLCTELPYTWVAGPATAV